MIDERRLFEVLLDAAKWLRECREKRADEKVKHAQPIDLEAWK